MPSPLDTLAPVLLAYTAIDTSHLVRADDTLTKILHSLLELSNAHEEVWSYCNQEMADVRRS